MKSIKQLAVLIIALLLLFSAAQAEEWTWAPDNQERFSELFALLGSAGSSEDADTAGIQRVLDEIRSVNETDYEIARAVADHWNNTVLNPAYGMFCYRKEDTVCPLEESGLDFSGKHAFVVMGYQLRNGSMVPELIGRCDAAAAAARAFPDSILICTGGATGSGNPEGYTEAGRMKSYLVNRCGIDPGRILTDPKAMTTTDNAVNALRIMREEGVESFTIVTSDYHQLWSQVVFNAFAAVYEKSAGYSIRLVGNFNLTARPEAPRTSGCQSGLQSVLSRFRKGVSTGP